MVNERLRIVLAKLPTKYRQEIEAALAEPPPDDPHVLVGAVVYNLRTGASTGPTCVALPPLAVYEIIEEAREAATASIAAALSRTPVPGINQDVLAKWLGEAVAYSLVDDGWTKG